MTPVLSIVTGTFQRLASLKRMIASVRSAIPMGIPYDFILCDGGSTDGTLEWARVQTDVVLIEHGELRGAIKAFCDGARASTADYVLLGNDDISFAPDSIAKALVYLETHPQCGAVAFADNRPAPGYEHLAGQYKVQTLTALDAKGYQVDVPYAQVGLVRRWLGELVGWWGDKDAIMSEGYTYGGDNYLSARIWELGYSVERVDGVRIDDHTVVDNLRQQNYEVEQKKPSAYYRRYASPPRLPDWQQVANTQTERPRCLYLPIFEPGHPIHRLNKRGLCDALMDKFLVYELDYINQRFDLPALVDWYKPDLLFMQLHGANEVTTNMLIEARNRKPDMVVINWNGDAHLHGLTSPPMLDLLKYIDLQLVVNAAALDVYAEKGIPAAYWQIGYEKPQGKLPRVPAHDVLFLGNNYNPQRAKLGTTLRKLKIDVGLYGQVWQNGDGNTLYDFAAGEALYKNAKIAISDTFHGETKAFVSNRLIQALAAGAFVLQEYIPALDQFTGLRDGVHFASWRTLTDLREHINFWLMEDNITRRDEIRLAGQAFVLERFSFEAQLSHLLTEILPTVEATYANAV